MHPAWGWGPGQSTQHAQSHIDGPLGYLIPLATVIAVFIITLDPGRVGEGETQSHWLNLFLKTESCSPFLKWFPSHIVNLLLVKADLLFG